jgi:hypothetical protein
MDVDTRKDGLLDAAKMCAMFTEVTVMLEKVPFIVTEYTGKIYYQCPLSVIDIILQKNFQIVCQSQREYWHRACLSSYRLPPKKIVNFVE